MKRSWTPLESSTACPDKTSRRFRQIGPGRTAFFQKLDFYRLFLLFKVVMSVFDSPFSQAFLQKGGACCLWRMFLRQRRFCIIEAGITGWDVWQKKTAFRYGVRFLLTFYLGQISPKVSISTMSVSCSFWSGMLDFSLSLTVSSIIRPMDTVSFPPARLSSDTNVSVSEILSGVNLS